MLQLFRLLTQVSHTSIRKISPNRGVQKGIYRFLNNHRVSENILIEELCDRYCSLAQNRHVLCIQDSTEMNYYSHRNRIKEDSGLDRLDSLQPALGFKMHSTLMLDASNYDVLGFSDVQLWHRPLQMPNRRERKYQSLAVEDKESYKWIRAANASKARLTQAKLITFIEDREGDFYEQLSSIAQKNVHYIIRSKSNRYTTDNLRAWDTLSKSPDLGSYTLSLQTDYRKNRAKKQINLKVRYATITIAKRGYMKNAKSYPPDLTVNIVEAYE